MNVEVWQKVHEEVVHLGDYRKIIRKSFILPNGKEAQFDVLHSNGTVGVLALTVEQEVVLARQFRPGTEQVFDELPGGLVNPGETPLEAVQREFLEETGYTGEFHFVAVCVASPYSARKSHCFIALNCRQVQEPKLDDKEFITVVKKPLSAFREQLRKGELTHVGVAYLCLDHLNQV